MYLDPGSGSYILQILLAGLLGGFFVIKANWQKVKSMFRRDKNVPKDDAENEQQ